MSKYGRRRLSRMGCAAAAAAIAMGAAACGSSDSTSTASSGGGSGDSSALVSQACAQATADQKPVSFTGPTESFDTTKAKGKTVWWINYGTHPTGVQTTKAALEAAAKLGITVKQFDGAFSVPEWNRGVLQAVAQKADAIVLFSIDSKLVSNGIAKAKAAGIPVIYVLSPSPTAKWGTEDADASYDFAGAGKMIANHIVCKTKGSVTGHVVTDTAYGASPAIWSGAQTVFSHCSSCKITTSNIPLQDWGTKVSTDVKSSLLKNPKVNFVWPLYDAGGPSAAAGIGEAGATSRVSLTGVNGAPANLALVCNGQQSASVGQPASWMGWAAMDQTARVLAGAPQVDEHVPNRLLVKANMTCPAPKAQLDSVLGTVDYRAQYEKLWSQAAGS